MYRMERINSDCLTPVSVFLRIQGAHKCLLLSLILRLFFYWLKGKKNKKTLMQTNSSA